MLTFSVILDTYGIIMRNKNHIYFVFRIILDTCNYNENKNHINCVFGLFETLMEL